MPNADFPHVLRVQITGPLSKVRQFLAAHPLEIDSIVVDHDTVSLRVYLEESLVRQLEADGLHHKVLFDATEQGRAHRARMGSGNRFDGGRIPVGLGTKTR